MHDWSIFQFYRRLGFSVIPIAHRSKRPVVNWKEFTQRHATDAEIKEWSGHGVGLVTGTISGFIGIDADSKEDARSLLKQLPKTECITITPSGGHFLYRAPEEQVRPSVKTLVKGVSCDIRGEGSYLVAAPSIHPSGVPYRRHGTWAVAPLFEPSWVAQTEERQAGQTRIHDARKYVRTIVAVAGQRGHDTTFRVACILRDVGLSEAEALVEMIEWNETNAVPRWQTVDLLHKVKSAFSRQNGGAT